MPARNLERKGTILYTDEALRRRLEELCSQWKLWNNGAEISLVEMGKLFGENAKFDLKNMKTDRHMVVPPPVFQPFGTIGSEGSPKQQNSPKNGQRRAKYVHSV